MLKKLQKMARQKDRFKYVTPQ